MSSLVPTPGLAVYGATKHAVLGYTLSLAGDLHRAGVPIRVTAVCPDAIETDMVSGVAHDEASSILFTSRKLLSPKDVADQIVDVLDHPRLVRAIPAHRAAMAHVLRPFPAVGLRIMEQLARVGSRHRRKRGATA